MFYIVGFVSETVHAHLAVYRLPQTVYQIIGSLRNLQSTLLSRRFLKLCILFLYKFYDLIFELKIIDSCI